MGDEVAAELLVQIKADIADLKAKFEEAKEHTGSFGEAMQEAGAKIAEFFAVEKIAQFVEESILGFAKVERGLDTLGAQVKQNNEDWGKLKSTVEDFLESEDKMYGFSKEQLLPVLNDLELKTGNIGVSMKLTDDAAKLATLGIGDLKGNADSLAKAFQGNSMGLKQLGTLLGLTKDQSKDAGLVFDTLAKKLSGVKEVLGDTQGKISSVKAGWESFTEAAGRFFAPVINLVAWFEKAFASMGFEVIKDFKLIFDVSKEVFEEIKAGLHFLENWKAEGLKAAIKDYQAESTKASKDANTAMLSDLKEYEEAFKKTWSNNTKTVKLETDAQLKTVALANKSADDARKKSEEDEKKSLADLAAEKKRVYGEIGKEVSSVTENMTKTFIDAAKSGADAWKAMGEAMAKYVIEAIGKQVEEMGHSKLLQAAAAQLDPLTAAAVPGLIASGIALEAAGGAIYGAAEVALAEGGIVNQPTIALIGENGPEKVTPLGKDDQSGVHFHGNINLSFPGVRRAGDFTASEQASAARSLLNTADELNRRSGKRAVSF